MSKLFVPVSIEADQNTDYTIARLKEMGATRVHLAAHRLSFAKNEKRKEHLALIRRNVDLYRAAGFDVAVWITTLGFGGPLADESDRDFCRDFTRITSLTGATEENAFCPTDSRFVSALQEMCQDLIRYAGADMIVLDDELCLNVRPGIGCACRTHLNQMSKILGREVKREELVEKVFTGPGSDLRDAWCQANGDALRGFCSALRQAIDQVDPTVRLGFCSGFTSWDMEGVDAIELTHIMAGKTKPFLRLSGSPYWPRGQKSRKQDLNNTIEFVRSQIAWCQGQGIEIFSEADSHPRIRFYCAAAEMECYDLALRASDDLDSFKYFFQYNNQPDYDTGYIEFHKRNQKLYDLVDEVFSPKTGTGIRIYEAQRKFRQFDLPKKFPGERPLMNHISFGHSQRLTSLHALPTVYQGKGLCGMVIGENAKHVDLSVCDTGLILDAKAALILKDRGVDVGIESAQPMVGGLVRETFEKYQPVGMHNASAGMDLVLKEGAQVQSRFTNIPKECPASYTYENAAGQRFLVFAFTVEEQKQNSSLLWSYSRGEQIADAVSWLGGRALPAVCRKQPYLYALTKEDGKKVAVGYWNMNLDEIVDAKVELGEGAKNIRFLGCEGDVIDEKTVRIRYIKPYGFAGLEWDKA